MYVVKRDGRLEPFNDSRIEKAVLGAMREVGYIDGEVIRDIRREHLRIRDIPQAEGHP